MTLQWITLFGFVCKWRLVTDGVSLNVSTNKHTHLPKNTQNRHDFYYIHMSEQGSHVNTGGKSHHTPKKLKWIYFFNAPYIHISCITCRVLDWGLFTTHPQLHPGCSWLRSVSRRRVCRQVRRCLLISAERPPPSIQAYGCLPVEHFKGERVYTTTIKSTERRIL